LAVVTVLIPVMGSLSDLYGRVRVIATAIIGLLLCVMPYFTCLTSGLFNQVLLFHCVMAVPCAAIFAVIPVFITEIFPLSLRCSIVNLIYSIAACLGGGITPIIALKLGERHDSSPGYILMVFGTMSLIGLALFTRKNAQKQNHLLLVE